MFSMTPLYNFPPEIRPLLEVSIALIFYATLISSYENPTKFHARLTRSTGLQNQYTDYGYNLAGGAPPNLAMKFVTLSPYQ